VRLEVVGVDGKIMLKYKLHTMCRDGQELYGSGQEQVAGCCERDNEPLVSIQCGKFSGCLRHCILECQEGLRVGELVGCLVGWLVNWLVCYLVGSLVV
jgi:hypothetical protein